MTPTPAELYRALHRGSPGDLSFYRQACEGAEHILELGCGYGRLVQALAQPGRQIIGLDQDEDLLKLAARTESNQAELRWVCGDMCALDLEERFDRILLAFNTFYCVPQEQKRPLLESIYRHLRPGGHFIMDAYSVSQSEFSGIEQFCPPEPIVTLSLEAGVIDVFEDSQEDYDRKTIQVTYGFYAGQLKVGSQSIQHAYWYDHEFQPALKDCGFESVAQTLGFGAELTQVVITARR
ncbi:MAG: hypothetical protein CMH55_06650 [Myxococcales bacterium]|nr:hypothetical protein [Myxococcales bacterium]